MSKSIRYYYFTSIATVLVSSVLIMSMIQVWLSMSYLRGQKETLLQRVVESVSEGVRTGDIQMDGQALLNVEYMADISEAEVILTDLQGRVLYATDGIEGWQEQHLAGSLLEDVEKAGIFKETGTLGGFYSHRFYTFGKALIGQGGVKLGYVFASSDASYMKVYMSDTLSSFILSAGLVLLVSSVLALVLTTRTVIPIRRVSNAAKRFGEGDYSARAPVEGDDELAQLAMTFNEMASSCEATDITRRSFMGNIAHELRTPMTTIKGFIDGMLDGTIPPEQRDKYLGIVSTEVGRLARLTQNMLDISKLEAGESTPQASTFDIWAPIAQVIVGAEQRLEEKHLNVEGIEPEQPIEVLADKDFVHQVLFNLVDNAIKFVDDEGTLSVRVTPGKTHVTVAVRNTGEGIDAEVLPYIFDRFYKGDESRGLNARGAGLGLHICKVLVNLMGGRVWAESELGAWAEFCFTLPNAPAVWAKGYWAQGAIKPDGEIPPGVRN